MVSEKATTSLNQPSLSIVLPCYNPISGWEQKVIASIQNIQERSNLKELIIVNDGSDRNIDSEIDSIKKQIPFLVYESYNTNRGKGYAIRKGLSKACSDIIIYTDIDFPYTTESFFRIHDVLTKGEIQIAAGVKEAVYYNNIPAFRKYISKILRKMIAIGLKIKVADTQCGLKGMQHQAKVIWLEGTIDRYLFDLEAIYNASKKNFSIVAVPVTLREGVVFSTISTKMLLSELRNFLKIILRR